jgi:hypothetical protein
MPPIEDDPAPAPAPAPAKSLYHAEADVFGRLAGSVWSLTAAQAAEGGNALRPIAADDAAVALWGRAPLVRD